MKKNIIMIIIILICSASLLLVLYYFSAKDIYYISENINNENIELSMIKIENGSTTTITETPTNGFYDITYDCNNAVSIYWSNNTHKLKVKVTNSPVKCSITFRKINNDLNIMGIYVDGVEKSELPNTNTVLYTLDYTNTKCYDDDNEEIENVIDSIEFDSLTNSINITNYTKKMYCYLYYKNTDNMTQRLTDRILEDNEIATGDRPNLNTKVPYTDTTTGIIYWTSTNTESVCENGDVTYVSGSGTNAICKSFYFAGNPTKNYVKFGGRIWRIIRINEDESVRLIDEGVTDSEASLTSRSTYTWLTAPYNAFSNDNRDIGWCYGTKNAADYADTHKCITRSLASGRINRWMRQNPFDVEYLSQTAIFCNDRSLSTTTPNGGYGKLATYYGAYDRLINQSESYPQFKCPNEEDKFTMSSSTGNGILGIRDLGGLITADEVAYIGQYYATDPSSTYTFIREAGRAYASSATMTPYRFGTIAYMYRLNSIASFTGTAVSNMPLKLVINLKGCVLYDKGDGTNSNPYTVKISTACKNAEN